MAGANGTSSIADYCPNIETLVTTDGGHEVLSGGAGFAGLYQVGRQ